MACTGCDQDKTIKARGMCAACYTHWQKYGTTQRVRMKREGCTVEGCDRPAHGRGLCAMHGQRQRRTGALETPSKEGKAEPISHHPLYPQWIDFQRKVNARPVVPAWRESFEAFLAGVGTRPTRRHRLYRLDTQLPFGPGNFEWRLALVEKIPGESAQEYNTRYHRAHRETYGNDYRDSDLSRRYGVGKREVAEMAEAQNHLCAICDKPEQEERNGLRRHLAVDHDHATGKVRELLCQSCNKMLGYAKDDPLILASAIAYLTKHLAAHPVPR